MTLVLNLDIGSGGSNYSFSALGKLKYILRLNDISEMEATINNLTPADKALIQLTYSGRLCEFELIDGSTTILKGVITDRKESDSDSIVVKGYGYEILLLQGDATGTADFSYNSGKAIPLHDAALTNWTTVLLSDNPYITKGTISYNVGDDAYLSFSYKSRLKCAAMLGYLFSKNWSVDSSKQLQMSAQTALASLSSTFDFTIYGNISNVKNISGQNKIINSLEVFGNELTINNIASDGTSQTNYGYRGSGYKMQIRELMDGNACLKWGEKVVSDYKNPITSISFVYFGDLSDITLGACVTVEDPENNLNGDKFYVIEKIFSFEGGNEESVVVCSTISESIAMRNFLDKAIEEYVTTRNQQNDEILPKYHTLFLGYMTPRAMIIKNTTAGTITEVENGLDIDGDNATTALLGCWISPYGSISFNKSLMITLHIQVVRNTDNDTWFYVGNGIPSSTTKAIGFKFEAVSGKVFGVCSDGLGVSAATLYELSAIAAGDWLVLKARYNGSNRIDFSVAGDRTGTSTGNLTIPAGTITQDHSNNIVMGLVMGDMFNPPDQRFIIHAAICYYYDA